VIATQSVELRAGARLLVKDVTVRINHGDRIGFVVLNGAGKSTLCKVLAGETMPAGGQITRTGNIGYLPQDPRTGDQDELVISRILSARGLDQIMIRMRKAEEALSTSTGDGLEAAMERYTRVDSEFNAAGGEEGRCGWLKDKYGLSWQIVPKQLGEAMGDPDPAKASHAMGAMMQMSKIIVKDLYL